MLFKILSSWQAVIMGLIIWPKVAGGDTVTDPSRHHKDLTRATPGPAQALAVLSSLYILPNYCSLKVSKCSYANVDF